jgi:hypothetical protein
MSALKSSGKTRAITMLARTSLRCYNASGEPPFAILDFGCGPGRDLKVFTDLGHIAIEARHWQRYNMDQV